MNIFTPTRKLNLALNVGLIYLLYFTNHTIIRRFFPQIQPQLKWTMLILYIITMFNYILTSVLKPGVVTVKDPPNVSLLGITDPNHIK